MKEVILGNNDDYACVLGGALEFYYGYEYPSIIGEDDEENEDWGFAVTNTVTNIVIFKRTQDELEKISDDVVDKEPISYLVLGMYLFSLDQNTKIEYDYGEV